MVQALLKQIENEVILAKIRAEKFAFDCVLTNNEDSLINAKLEVYHIRCLKANYDMIEQCQNDLREIKCLVEKKKKH